jgi:hypothetical protein
VSSSENNYRKNYSFKSENNSCVKSDLNSVKAYSQKWFIRFENMVRHILYFEIDFYANQNNSVNIIRAHTNHIRGCTHQKLETSFNSSLMRYGFRCDMKFEGIGIKKSSFILTIDIRIYCTL